MAGLATALDEVTLVLFTTLAPSGAVAYAIMGAAGAMGAWPTSGKRVSRALLIPFLVTLVGLVASATHLGNPDNAFVRVLPRGAQALCRTRCFAAVLFLSASGLHWLYQFAEHARPRVLNALMGAAILASFAFVPRWRSPMPAATVVTWDTPFVPVALCLNALVGGPVLAVAGLRLAQWEPLEGKAGWALLALSLAALVVNAGVYVAQGASVLPLRNYLVSAEQLVPTYGAMVIAFCVLAAAGLAVDAAGLLRGPRHVESVGRHRVGARVCRHLRMMRFAFYMMHMTYGIRPVTRCSCAMCYACGTVSEERQSMRIIISPAKKMNVVDDAFGWRELPMFADEAARLADAVRALSYEEAKALWQCSDALAELNFERFRTMDVRGDAAALTPAVLAYEGIQYQRHGTGRDDGRSAGLPAAAPPHPVGLLRRAAPLRRRGALSSRDAGQAGGGRRARSVRVLGRRAVSGDRCRGGRHRESGIGRVREGGRALCRARGLPRGHLPVRQR